MSHPHPKATRYLPAVSVSPKVARALIALMALLALGGLLPTPVLAQAPPTAASAAADPSRQGYGMGYANRQLEPAPPAASAASAAAVEPKAAPPVRPVDRQSLTPMPSRGHGGGRRGGR